MLSPPLTALQALGGSGIGKVKLVPVLLEKVTVIKLISRSVLLHPPLLPAAMWKPDDGQ